MRYHLFLMVGYALSFFTQSNCSMRLKETAAIVEQLFGMKKQLNDLSQSQFQLEEEESAKLKLVSMIELAEDIIAERCKHDHNAVALNLHSFFATTVKTSPSSKRLLPFIHSPQEYPSRDFCHHDESDYATSDSSTYCSSLSSPILTPQAERKIIPIPSSHLRNDSSSSKKSSLTKLSPNEVFLIQKVCDELSTMEEKDIASVLKVTQEKKRTAISVIFPPQ